jgi:hypothetical protein
MRNRSAFVLLLMLALVLAACADRRDTAGDRPVLLEDATLAPTTPPPSPVVGASSTPEASPEISPTPFVSELNSPLEVVTIEADFVIVTPTLPPSKTPTATPTNTTPPTFTPTPTLTVTSTEVAPLFPTSIIIPVTAMVVQPVDRLCDSQWTFFSPPPGGCPFAPATVTQGVFQEFERGIMFWDGSARQIYVLFSDGQLPYWTRFDDTFFEGQGQFPNAPWKDPAIDGQAPVGMYQPVRGFGRLWRNEDNNPTKGTVRGRVGWGTIEEIPYSLKKQTRQDGTLFLNTPDGRVFVLTAGGMWSQYAGFSY